MLGELGGRFQSTCITTKNATCVAEWVFNLKNTMGSDCLWDSILKYGNGTNELEGMQAEFSAQIVHAVNQLSLHFNIIRKKSHPLTFIKRANVKIHCHLLSVFVLGDEKLNNEGQIPMPIVTDKKKCPLGRRTLSIISFRK